MQVFLRNAAQTGQMRPAGSLPSNDEIFAAGDSSLRESVFFPDRPDEEDRSEPSLLAYAPTRTSNPPRPRTRSAYYNPQAQVLTIRWRDDLPEGGPSYYAYYDVPRNIWNNFRRSVSPGRFVNRVLNRYRYSPVDGVQ
jgi:hypothetical protein